MSVGWCEDLAAYLSHLLGEIEGFGWGGMNCLSRRDKVVGVGRNLL
jgi:hypothetical protein